MASWTDPFKRVARVLSYSALPLRFAPNATDVAKVILGIGEGGGIVVLSVLIWQRATDIGSPFGVSARDVQTAWLSFVSIGLFAVAALRLTARLDDYTTPRVRLGLGDHPIAHTGEIRHDYWLEIWNATKVPIRDVTVVVRALNSANGTYGLNLYVGARFREQASGKSDPVTIPVGTTPTRFDLISQGEVAAIEGPLVTTTGLLLCCDTAAPVPRPLPFHSEKHRYSMTVEVRGADLQALPEHSATVEFWSAQSSGTVGATVSLTKCVVVATPDAR